MHKRFIIISLLFSFAFTQVAAQSFVSQVQTAGSIDLANANIYVDSNDADLVIKAAALLQQDIETVTGKRPAILHTIQPSNTPLVIIGSLEQSALVKTLSNQHKLNTTAIKNKWEAFQIQLVQNPAKGIQRALVITGSDRRGTAFGVFELSRQIGVSPWYWWADVPVKKKSHLFIKSNTMITDAPKVKYRGIFINDEAPALSNWSKATFGGFNHHFYSKVFELMLRLKSNYIWPAMWGNAFYDDDSINIKTADEYGIVIGTSHHEPLMRAHDEWRRHGSGKWNYETNETNLKEFWKSGMQRATNEKIVSIGMRGDGDEPMSRETATALLEKIVQDQRTIIANVTGKPAEATPQLWALYKEVQDYYDKGMRVPDDVTLLLCDDNWGNIRKLPKLNEKPRKGGYGIYYHFDYVGGPRNYKWLNTNPLPRIWEQMHLAYEYKVKDIWIVNVGDIKPMELPISFFLDYAWNPDRIGAGDLQKYTDQWSAAQFGEQQAREIGQILSAYSKYNGRRKPELLDEKTYSIANYQEAQRVTNAYNNLLAKAEKIHDKLSPAYRDAFFQLVLHPVKAGANLQQLYTTVAANQQAAKLRQANTNMLADRAKQLYLNDSLITLQYHAIANGKWNHMMSQTHIGYTYWQQPNQQKMPAVKYLAADSVLKENPVITPGSKTAEKLVPANSRKNIFFEKDGYVSMEADHFTNAINSNGITWKILPDHGRTGSAVTSFPVTSQAQEPTAGSPQLQYEFYTYSAGAFKVTAHFSPTLNFHNTATGLQYAVSIDGEAPQIISINKEDNINRVWENWVANNIIAKTTQHTINKPGRHVLRYSLVHPGVVLQKLVLDFGGIKPSYLAPPETIYTNDKN